VADSPYKDLPENKWLDKTKKLIASHPLPSDVIVKTVLQSWNDIFETSIGKKGFRIGKDIRPKPQIMGFLLHELIPVEFAALYPEKWRGEKTKSDKDIVYIPDELYSIELKTSSAKGKIFGNRSYAQVETAGKKGKSGFYLTANFGKFLSDVRPEITQIRFGWLDHSDWVGQAAETGQQSHLKTASANFKLLTLYEHTGSELTFDLEIRRYEKRTL
jgi:hypothetical protein